MKRINSIGLCFAVTVLSACGGGNMNFPVSEAAQARLPDDLQIVRVSTRNIDHLQEVYFTVGSYNNGTPPPLGGPYTYRLGAGDQLRIQVWTTPERSAASTEQSARPVEGPVVDADGTFFYPFVGEIRAQGRTISAIREELTDKLRAYLTTPQVEVAVEEFRAHRVTISGAVGAAGQTTLTNVPLYLVDLVNSAGAAEDADLSRVVLRRQGREYRINLRRYFEEGSLRHNPVLQPGDAVYIPELSNNEAYVFGEISTTPVPLGVDGMSLTELLARVGGIDRVRANAKGVFVFRRTGLTREGFDVVFQFDLSNASTLLLMQDFEILPQDIVFVTRDPVTRWTDTVGRVLLPARSAVQAQGVASALSDG